MDTQLKEPERETFVEAVMKMGGKTEEEARKTGTLDRADEQVDALFAARYQTANSPAHRAVWDRTLPVELFLPQPPTVSAACQRTMQQSLEAVSRHRAGGTLYGPDSKISQAVLDDLSAAGYWGLLIDPQYGGVGAPFAAFSRFLMKMATIEPNVAGLASVHGCIGAVDPLRTFGTPDQKERYLPKLASGEKLSAFALTEPCAGSDLTALRTTARLDGDEYVVEGEKLFITNAVPGRTIGLVCRIEDRPSVLIVDLPDHENDQFKLVTYGLFALKRLHNNGLKFHGLRVPSENLLKPTQGDGLTIAYHGLNLGRVALCATAAGSMRVMLANLLPWAKFRRTYGAAIVTRELVLRRIGRLAGLIVGCDALVDWCSWLLDQGYRGELECIIAKIFGSESQKEAAIELFMKTHGGRAFLRGHLFGENVHEYLAPCIYEGEGEVLGMAFFKSLIKEHGKTFFEPVGRALSGRRNSQAESAQPCACVGAQGGASAVLQVARRRDDCAAATCFARRSAHSALPFRLCRLCRGGLGRQPCRDQQPAVQAPASSGGPAMQHGRALAADPGSCRDARHESLGRAPAKRGRARRRGSSLRRPEATAHGPQAVRRRIQGGHQAR